MPKRLIQFIFILIALLFAMNAKAGIIIRPVHNFGLVGYWDFQEGAGITVNDKTGYDNDGAWYGTGSHWADGKIGKGGSFNGSDDGVSGSGVNLANSAFTISYWQKPATTSGDQTAVSVGSAGTTDQAIHLRNVSGGATFRFGMYADDLDLTTTITAGNWYHVVVTLNNSKLQSIYWNGVFRTSRTAGNFFIGNTNWGIGRWVAAADYFNGVIDEVRIYNRALSASEVERLYKLSQPKILAPTKTGLVGYWSFEEGTGTKAGDMSGNGNHGTWNGTGSHWTSGKLGTGGSFNGSSDYVDMGDPTNGSLDFATNDFSISAWAYTPVKDTGSTSHSIVEKWNWSITVGGYSLGTRYGNYTLQLGNDSGGACTIMWYGDNGIGLTAGKWEHIVATIDRDGNATMYLNGGESSYSENISAGSACDLSNSYKFFIGAANRSTTTHYFNGAIDEVRIYNRALETSEITALYNSGLAKINASQNNQLTNGLVGLWSFNGPDMDGTTAIDRSGQGNNGTLTGGPTRTIGKVGQALSFNGTSDYVGTNLPTSDNQSFTYSAWFNTKTLAEAFKEIVGDHNVQGAPNIRGASIRIYSDPGYVYGFMADSAGSGGTVYYNLEATLNTWYHVAITYDYSTSAFKLYTNGVFHNTGTDSATVIGYKANSVGRWEIGRQHYDLYYFNGLIDEVRAYNRALSAQEILRLYNMGR